jgi:hypothetical protein
LRPAPFLAVSSLLGNVRLFRQLSWRSAANIPGSNDRRGSHPSL